MVDRMKCGCRKADHINTGKSSTVNGNRSHRLIIGWRVLSVIKLEGDVSFARKLGQILSHHDKAVGYTSGDHPKS